MMPVRYSTNWMGPVSLRWYEDRGLTEVKQITVLGETIEVNDITERYSAGRIDIYGVDGGGKSIEDEYGLAPMKSEDWELLSNWLDSVATDFVWSKEDLLANFERYIGRPIVWSER